MTKDEIISMAKDAGFLCTTNSRVESPAIEGGCLYTWLEYFAELVAKKERDKCVEIIENTADCYVDYGNCESINPLLSAIRCSIYEYGNKQ